MELFIEKIDAVLHGAENLDFAFYREGELYLLQNEVRKMTIRLREQTELLSKDKTVMADFLADVSHQIRTPLTAIQLLCASVCNESLSDTQRTDKLKEIIQQITRIEWLVDALLKLARIDAGTIEMKANEVLFSDLISKAILPFEIPMELKAQRLETQLTGSFRGDMAWTSEAVGNIIKNCIEHMGNNGVLRITSEENALFSQLIIIDNGPGFSEKDLAHLFERFYRGDDAKSGNIGIGLSLARRIITAQNGTIKASNFRSGGAMFEIRFYKSEKQNGEEFSSPR